LLERHPQKANELYAYMAIIRSAASECAIEKWYAYDQQLQLRVARDHTQNWGLIDGQLWLQLIALGIQNNPLPIINVSNLFLRVNVIEITVSISINVSNVQ
jgi:hypothetical protein